VKLNTCKNSDLQQHTVVLTKLVLAVVNVTGYRLVTALQEV